jgi:hypothetical protein
MGEWLARKWYHCQEMKHDAESELKRIEIPISALREQWMQQTRTQTKPTPREFRLFVPTFAEFLAGQSKLAGKREVEAILLLEQNLKASRQQLRLLERQVFNDAALGSYAVETSLEVQELRETCNYMSDNIRKKRAALGVGQRMALSRIQENEFLQIRVNALALKKRIRDRLRQRKFEREPLERSYRHAKRGKVT